MRLGGRECEGGEGKAHPSLPVALHARLPDPEEAALTRGGGASGGGAALPSQAREGQRRARTSKPTNDEGDPSSGAQATCRLFLPRWWDVWLAGGCSWRQRRR
ncbi:unnamed protein product [Urochloa humidicola]